MKRVTQTLTILAGLVAMVLFVVPAQAASVYDSNIENRLGLSAGQRPKVVRIVRTSRTQRNKILRKHKVDPNGKPDLRRLSFAGSELRALARRERGQLTKVLSKQQLAKYDAIIAETRKRIINAANKKD